jgi:hypothetical protein
MTVQLTPRRYRTGGHILVLYHQSNMKNAMGQLPVCSGCEVQTLTHTLGQGWGQGLLPMVFLTTKHDQSVPMANTDLDRVLY